MNKVRIINIKRGGLPQDAKYCGRGSPYGNPYPVGLAGMNREEVCKKFEELVLPKLDVEPLRGFDLACYCVPLQCHCFSIYKKLYGTRYEI